jgi:hypothetical protein
MSNEVSRIGKHASLARWFDIDTFEPVTFLGLGTNGADDLDDNFNGLRQECADGSSYNYHRVPINANASFPEDSQHGGSTEFVGTDQKAVLSVGLFKQDNINPAPTSPVTIREVGLFATRQGDAGDYCASRNTLAISVDISSSDEIAFRVTTYQE